MLSGIGVIVIAVVAALSLLIAIYRFSKNYIKVPPNAVAILSGKKHKAPDGTIIKRRSRFPAFSRSPSRTTRSRISAGEPILPVSRWSASTSRSMRA